MSKRSKNKKQQPETSKPVNYDLFNQKITFEFLKSHLWAAADILRGSLDPLSRIVEDNTHLKQRLFYFERLIHNFRNEEVKKEYFRTLSKVLEAEEALRHFEEVFNNSK